MILEVKNLCKSYKKIKAIDGISFNVKSGEVYALIGPNGAGKSTLLKIILGLLKYDSGDVTITNEESENKKHLFGALIDQPAYYDYLTGRENIEFFQEVEDAREVEKLLETVGLNKLDSHRKVSEYSLGMKQRLGIAQALIGDKPIIVLDEPLNGLDAEGIYDIRNIILREAKKNNKIVIITSHILSEIEKVADGIMIFNKGKTLFKGKMSELIQEEYTIIFDTKINKDEILNIFGGNASQILYISDFIVKFDEINTKNMNAILKKMLEKGLEITEVKKTKKSLEEFYFSILEEK